MNNTNPLLKINERAFTHAVVELAHWNQWLVFHPLPAQTSRGRWVTATQGDTGFPDLVLVKPGAGIIFAELKTAVGRVSDQQRRWLDAIEMAGGESHIWRPIDINHIRKRLGQ